MRANNAMGRLLRRVSQEVLLPGGTPPPLSFALRADFQALGLAGIETRTEMN